MNLQKFFEIQEPYYALIKAEDGETAINVYTDVVADFDKDVNPYEEIKEVPSDYAILKAGRGFDESTGNLISISEILEQLRSTESKVLLIDSSLL